MDNPYSDDILLPNSRTPAVATPHRAVAFIPITVAVAGVAAILLGRVTAHDSGAIDAQRYLDPVVTGSISAPATSSNDLADDR